MEQAESESFRDASFGFLTAVETQPHGVFGGFLVVDLYGRPLEFYCTAPVRVTRAQQILYGATLKQHLYGERIGAALLDAVKTTPAAVLTDLESMLPLGATGGVPMAFVALGDEEPSLEGPTIPAVRALAGHIDLSEPFGRIRAAIEEAQRHS
jgi:hypothetical protein